MAVDWPTTEAPAFGVLSIVLVSVLVAVEHPS